MKTYRQQRYSSTILDLNIKWRSKDSFMRQLLSPQEKET
jgi:hypothetical protein